MTWAKVDDQLHGDPRAAVAGLEAMGLYVLALSYMGAYLTDGTIGLPTIKRFAGRKAPTLAARLVDAGFWESKPGDIWVLMSWDKSLLSRTYVERQREDKSKAGRAGAARTNAKSLETGSAPAAVSAGGASDAPDPVPSRPVQEEKKTPKPPAGGSGGGGFKLEPAEPKKRGRVKAAERPKDAEPKRSAQDAYLDAFVAGIADAGHAVTRPRKSDADLLGNACRTHAKVDGAPIVGDALPPWIRSEVAAFRRAISRPEVWKGGISVFGLIAWWDAGRPVQAPTFKPSEPEAEEDDPDKWDPPPGARPPPTPLPRRGMPPGWTPEMTARGLAYAEQHGMIGPRQKAAADG